jgi:hypothetical protein
MPKLCNSKLGFGWFFLVGQFSINGTVTNNPPQVYFRKMITSKHKRRICLLTAAVRYCAVFFKLLGDLETVIAKAQTQTIFKIYIVFLRAHTLQVNNQMFMLMLLPNFFF